MVRKDKFKEGDKVRLAKRFADSFIVLNLSWIQPDNIYTISRVVDVPLKPAHDGSQSNHQSMGHTQHVDIKEDPRPSYDYPRWSGAYWVLVSVEDLLNEAMQAAEPELIWKEEDFKDG